MLNETDDIDELDVRNPNLYDNLRKKLYSIRDELKISIIGKVSTPTNLLIKKLTDIDFTLCRTWEINRYCTVISNSTKIFMKEQNFSDNENFQLFKKDFLNDKNACLVVCKKMSKNEPLSVSVDKLGSYLEKYINEGIDKFEIYLPKSENSILNECIIYNTPPIGYSDELDKFVVEQCYKSCDLYVFVINSEESILEKEMKIISMLMEKRKVIELKFVMAYSGKMSSGDYIITEQHYFSKIKEIITQFPGIIIISGHGYISNGKESIYNSPNEEDAVPEENRITNLGEFIHRKPTEEMISAAVKNFKLKSNSSIKSAFVENNENIKNELRNSIENIKKIINFISKSVKSNDLKDEICKLNKTIRSISLGNIYGSNYVIFGNPFITSLDILQAMIEQHISIDKTLISDFSIIKCNFMQTNREYFVLQNDNKSIYNEYDIYELNNLSKLISKLGVIANENISIELYLDNIIHPIIKEEMKIIYYNDFDIDNEELLNECEDHDKIAVILDYKSYNEIEIRNKIKRCQSTYRHVPIYIQISNCEKISNDIIKEDIQKRLEIEIEDVINESDFNLKFYKILSNLKYRKTANEIILIINQFISHLDDKSIKFDVNIKDISDWQFQQLDETINSKIKPIQNNNKEFIPSIANREINGFVEKIFMENMNISDKTLFTGTLIKDIFEEAIKKEHLFSREDGCRTGRVDTFMDKIRNIFIKNECSIANDFLNYYAENKIRLMEKINNIYISKTREILSDSKRYKKMLSDIIDNLQMKNRKFNIFVYNNSNK